jgi:hypothetical protein
VVWAAEVGAIAPVMASIVIASIEIACLFRIAFIR